MKTQVNFYTNDNPMFRDAMDSLAVNIHFKKQQLGYTSITICGASASAGTTTMAINLAISAALSGWRTVLIDGDMRKKTYYKKANISTEVGLGDYLDGKLKVEDIIFPTNYNMLYYIPCGQSQANPVSLLCSPNMDTLHDFLKENYDFVIYDTSAVNIAVDASIIASKTDTTCVIVNYGETEKEELENAVKKLTTAEANILGCIINQVEKAEYIRSTKDCDYYRKTKYRKRAVNKKNRKGDENV